MDYGNTMFERDTIEFFELNLHESLKILNIFMEFR